MTKNLVWVVFSVLGLCCASGAAHALEPTQPPAHPEISLATTSPEPAPTPAAANAPLSLPMPRLALVDDLASEEAPDANLDLTPKKPEQEQHLTESWWFWGAVAGVVVTTVAIVWIAGRPLEKPASDLGDMRAF